MKKMHLVLIATLALPLGACGSVDNGNLGMWKSWGAVTGEIAQPGGPYLHNPFTSSLEEINIQEQPWKAVTPIFTRDLQTANVTFTITTSLDPKMAVNMFKTVGPEWRDKLIPPLVAGTIKNIFGQYTAAEAVSKRGEMQEKMLNQLRSKFATRGIIVNDFALTNTDFSEAFKSSVERAQVATQNAIAAKNHTVEVEEQARQTRIQAEAEADRIRVQASAITQNPAIVHLRWVEKWNGEMPSTVYCSSSIPCVQGGAK